MQRNCRFQKTPPQRGGGDKVLAVWTQGPRFPAGLPSPVPRSLEFVLASRDSGQFFQQFSRDFPGVSSRTPEQTPETATALSLLVNSLMFCTAVTLENRGNHLRYVKGAISESVASFDLHTRIPKRCLSKRGRTQKQAGERKRAQTRVCKRAQKRHFHATRFGKW